MEGKVGMIRKEHLPRVSILLNNKQSYVNADEVFYNDLLLKNGNMFQVERVEQDASNMYKFIGKERTQRGIVDKTISSDDIKEYMRGFRILTEKEDESSYDFADSEYDIDTMDSTADESDSEGSTYGEGEEEKYTYEEGEEEPSFKDIQRTGKIYDKLSSTQKKYYELIKRILNLNNENIDDIDVYGTVDDIMNVLQSFDKQLNENNVNFDIMNSIIDTRMIIACIVSYRMLENDMVYPGFEEYIKILYDAGYFPEIDIENSLLFERSNTIFKCTEKVTRVDSQLIKLQKMMQCFNVIIQRMMNKNILLKSNIESSKQLALEAKAIVPNLKEYKTFITLEDILQNKDIPDTVTKIIWGPGSMKYVKEWKELLIKKQDELKDSIDQKDINKRNLYRYVNDNLDLGPIALTKLSRNIIVLLEKYFEEFKSYYDECEDERIDKFFDVKRCKENVIQGYIDKIFSDKKGKMRMISQNENVMLQRYTELSRIFNRLIDQIKEKYRDPRKLQQTMETMVTQQKKRGLESRRYDIQKSKSEDTTEVEIIKLLKSKFQDFELSYKKCDDIHNVKQHDDYKCKVRIIENYIITLLSKYNKGELTLSNDNLALIKLYNSRLRSDNISDKLKQKKMEDIDESMVKLQGKFETVGINSDLSSEYIFSDSDSDSDSEMDMDVDDTSRVSKKRK